MSVRTAILKTHSITTPAKVNHDIKLSKFSPDSHRQRSPRANTGSAKRGLVSRKESWGLVGVGAWPNNIKDVIDTVDVRTAVTFVKAGQTVLKYKRWKDKNPHPRYFRVDFDTLSLIWTSPDKSIDKTTIAMSKFTDIRPGVCSPFWRKSPDHERLLGIELLSKQRDLRILCGNEENWRLWFTGLIYARKKALTKQLRNREVNTLLVQRMFSKAGLRLSKSISFSDLILLLQQVGIKADVRYIGDVFDFFNQDGDDILEWDEFLPLLDWLLESPHIDKYFNTYHDERTNLVTEDSLKAFLQDVQQATPSEVELFLNYIQDLEEPFAVRKDGAIMITSIGFRYLLTYASVSPSLYKSIHSSRPKRSIDGILNSWLDPSKCIAYQSQNEPIQSYWISSSYLSVQSNSANLPEQINQTIAQRLEKLLRQGCRYIHLDVTVDEESDELVVQSKFGRWQVITFEKALRVIQISAFAVRCKQSESQCVVDNRLSVNFIARHAETVLGNQVVDKKSAGGRNLTLETLKRLILIRADTLNCCNGAHKIGNEHDVSLLRHRINLSDENLCLKFSKTKCGAVSVEGNESDQEEDEDVLLTFRAPCHRPWLSMSLPLETNQFSDDRSKLRHFEEITFFHTFDMKQFMHDRKLSSNALVTGSASTTTRTVLMSNDAQVLGHLSQKSDEIIKLTANNLVSIYPAQGGQCLREINPIDLWHTGCQLVATGNSGLPGLLNLARFVDNGGCGYVLKPKYLRFPECSSAKEASIVLSIRVLSAKQLPKVTFAEMMTDAPSPFVKVTVHGTAKDIQSFSTPVVYQNGFNPEWDVSFQFNIMVPSVAILTIEVENHHHHLVTELLACAAVSIPLLRQGLRWVPLRDKHLRSIPWSGLLIFVTKKVKLWPSNGSASINGGGHGGVATAEEGC